MVLFSFIFIITYFYYNLYIDVSKILLRCMIIIDGYVHVGGGKEKKEEEKEKIYIIKKRQRGGFLPLLGAAVAAPLVGSLIDRIF